MLQRELYWAMAEEAASHVSSAGIYPVDAVVQCGSGLAALIDALLPEHQRLPMEEVPHMPASAVSGHGRELFYGTVGTSRVLIFSGRFHLYEGHDPLVAAFPAALAKALGARLFLLTNAAGGLNQHFAAGDVMLHSDYINFQGDNPLAQLITDDSAEKFVDPKPPYDYVVLDKLARELDAAGLSVQRGIYIGVRGPVFETLAELRMMRSFGADAVGMSSVPEIILCNFLRLPVVGLSVITNECFSPLKLTHQQVVEGSQRAASRIGTAFKALLEGAWQ
jgi:purine-nucleoside phosphorylase